MESSPIGLLLSVRTIRLALRLSLSFGRLGKTRTAGASFYMDVMQAPAIAPCARRPAAKSSWAEGGGDRRAAQGEVGGADGRTNERTSEDKVEEEEKSIAMMMTATSSTSGNR